MKQQKNILVQYQGGGYDGCLWAWNFFVIDKEGKFHNIYASGYKGIKTEERAKKFLEEAPDFHNKRFIYRLNIKKDVKEFETESNPGHVVGVTRMIADLVWKEKIPIDTIQWHCDKCGAVVKYDGHGDDYIGDGGIGVQATTKLCDNCYYFAQDEEAV
jgi:hypothetical protein